MNDWNGFDFLVFLIFAVNTIVGMSRGATREVISMLCLSVALIFTIKFTLPLANFLNSSPVAADFVDNPVTIRFIAAVGVEAITLELMREVTFGISLLLCFAGAFCICEAALTTRGFTEMMTFPYATLNKKVGAALGCTRGFIINVVMVNILVLHIFSGNGNAALRNSIVGNSYFVKLLLPSAIKLDGFISNQTPESYKEMFDDKAIYNEESVLKTLNYDSNPLRSGQPQPQNPPPALPSTPGNSNQNNSPQGPAGNQP